MLFRRLTFLAIAFSASVAHAAWFDVQWSCRRPIDVNWDAEHGADDSLCQIEFYTSGHGNPSGDDIRICDEEGKILPSKVLMMGPGDQARVLFNLVKGTRKYYAYFGNAQPPPPKVAAELKITTGLLLEMKQFTGGQVGNFEQMEASWNRSKPVLGSIMEDRPFLGVNPLGDQSQTISKFTGTLYCPVDAEYLFAASAEKCAALYLDGQPVLFAPNLVGDIRYQKKLSLHRGPHEFLLYQLVNGGEGRVSVGWKRPDMDKVQVIGRDSLGILSRGTAGRLEEFKKSLTADFSVEYEGEVFIADAYTHRYKLTAQMPKSDRASAQWDFGDGQTATGPIVEHVFMTDGVYPIQLTIHLGANSDTQTLKMLVSRDFQHLDHPPLDKAEAQAKIAMDYDVSKLPLRWLPRAVMLHLRGGQTDAMRSVANRLAAEKQHSDANVAYNALAEASRVLLEANRQADVADLWDRVGQDSDLQPRAARYEAQVLLWWSGDFDRAAKVLRPFSKTDDAGLQRSYAEALILDRDVDTGRKLLQSLPISGQPFREAAMSGAMARTIEYFIEEKDWESGEQEWEKWEAKYPQTFLEGYSVLLRTRLMELKQAPQAAAKVAEAFAEAVPDSSYSPTLLDRASKLLAQSDPQKSQALRELLKKRYPEDPLSQDAPPPP